MGDQNKSPARCLFKSYGPSENASSVASSKTDLVHHIFISESIADFRRVYNFDLEEKRPCKSEADLTKLIRDRKWRWEVIDATAEYVPTFYRSNSMSLVPSEDDPPIETRPMKQPVIKEPLTPLIHGRIVRKNINREYPVRRNYSETRVTPIDQKVERAAKERSSSVASNRSAKSKGTKSQLKITDMAGFQLTRRHTPCERVI